MKFWLQKYASSSAVTWNICTHASRQLDAIAQKSILTLNQSMPISNKQRTNRNSDLLSRRFTADMMLSVWVILGTNVTHAQWRRVKRFPRILCSANFFGRKITRRIKIRYINSMFTFEPEPEIRPFHADYTNSKIKIVNSKKAFCEYQIRFESSHSLLLVIIFLHSQQKN